ncbi:MAG: anaerobic ribonucleoside-triphosphate reductase activating protein [Ruminococcaceae bacterium]|nr:anaerobic ribonucleoside-triphosphate reductase activating protein [Oscillospiraceae bacterium]
MKLHGIQKMTLLDFPGVVSCTIFLGGCDFRCPFCHNFELIDGTAQPIMDEGELIDFLKSRKTLIDGVAITGGEPCLHKDLPELIRKIRAEGYKVKLDTNGYHPEILKAILDEGLVEYVAMDIKNSEDKYALTCGLDEVNLDTIRKSISILMNSGTDYEFRTTVVDELHETEDFEKIGEMIKGARHYFLQRFTDRDSVPYGNLSAPSFEKMHEYAEIAKKYVENTELRGVE